MPKNPKEDSDSVIVVSEGSTSFVGPDSVQLYRAKVLVSALQLYAKTGLIPTRGVTITKMLAVATGYTGKAYKRGDALKAAEDVRQWALTMQAGLPVIIEGER